MARAIVKTFQPEFPVGSVMSSMLDEATFQAQNGTGWVLADGRSVVGSDYEALMTPIIGGGASNIPDARGRFLRSKDNGAGVNPDGEITLGNPQSHAFGAHDHRTQMSGSGTNNSLWHPNPTLSTNNRAYATAILNDTSFGYYDTHMEVVGASETRPSNVTVNYFIKINN